MNKTLLYIGAAVLGIGAAALLFMGGGGDEPEAPVPAVASGGASPSDVDAPESDEPAATIIPSRDENLQRRPEPAEGEDGEEERYVSPMAAEMRALLDAPYGQFTNTAAPAWSLMAMKLSEAGEDDLSVSSRDVAMELRRSRRDTEPDVAGQIAAQRSLLEEIKSSSVSDAEGVPQQIARLEELIDGLESGEGSAAESEPGEDEAPPIEQ